MSAMKIRACHVATTLILLAAPTLAGCGAPAQIGAAPETFKTVDALYTAVSLRDPELIDRCLATLKEQNEAGKLEQAPLDALDGIVAEAKSGAWESAQSRLARFMRGQRRGRSSGWLGATSAPFRATVAVA